MAYFVKNKNSCKWVSFTDTELKFDVTAAGSKSQAYSANR